MQKWTAVLFAMLAVAAVAVMIGERPRKGGASPTPTIVADAALPDAGATGALRDGGQPATAASANPDAGGSAPSPSSEEGLDPALVFSLGSSDAGATLIDGVPAPPLAADAPKSVVFGVILVQYKGAQAAPPNARSHEAALELAKQIAADAKVDFKAALAKGDKGSLENAGRMPRGILEAAPEYVLFSLPKDGVSDPVDTPRGFWIVRRIE
jgi:PPIC-type PPIASE domain